MVIRFFGNTQRTLVSCSERVNIWKMGCKKLMAAEGIKRTNLGSHSCKIVQKIHFFIQIRNELILVPWRKLLIIFNRVLFDLFKMKKDLTKSIIIEIRCWFLEFMEAWNVMVNLISVGLLVCGYIILYVGKFQIIMDRIIHTKTGSKRKISCQLKKREKTFLDKK